jgi:2-polyprenyl-6-methoxyphenol hydroxylase-like FAD-dependent oxidoreductase
VFVNAVDVIVVGAGPVGLMLATELRLAGAAVLVLERRAEPDTAIKAEGINCAAAEAFERRGLLPELLDLHRPYGDGPAAGRHVGHFGGIGIPADPVDADDAVLRHRGAAGWGMLLVAQVQVERILQRHAEGLGVEVLRGVEVLDLQEDSGGVMVRSTNGADLHAGWVVGCDGGHSTVRRIAGFEFVGTDPEIIGRHAMATVEGADALRRGWQHTPRGLYVYGPKPGRVRTVEFGAPVGDRDAPMTAAEMQASLRRVSGADVRVRDVLAGGRFTDNTRQATTYRRGRVLLCGDAAHVHSPFSGQGLNLGIGDAVNLGWKLAATVHGWAPEGLLDTYTDERHPIGASVLDWTRAQTAVMRGDHSARALRAVVESLLGTRDGATFYVKQTSGLAQRYPGGSGHPTVGALTPNFELADGTRLSDHTRDGRALLLDADGDDGLASLAAPYAGRLTMIRRRVPTDADIGALLVRPDGYVAWAVAAGERDHDGLTDALTRWLGCPS